MKPDLIPYRKALEDYLVICRSLLTGEAGREPDLQRSLSLVGDSCHLTSQSVITLIAEGALWDAEILVRTVCEGTMKFAYLCTGNADERSAQGRGVHRDLSCISDLRTHRRAKMLLSFAPAPESPEWAPIKALILPEEHFRETSVNAKDAMCRSCFGYESLLVCGSGLLDVPTSVNHSSGLPRAVNFLVGITHIYVELNAHLTLLGKRRRVYEAGTPGREVEPVLR